MACSLPKQGMYQRLLSHVIAISGVSAKERKSPVLVTHEVLARKALACHACIAGTQNADNKPEGRDAQDPPQVRWGREEPVMTSKSAEEVYGSMEELHAALDAIPADDPRNYLRQSLQLLGPLLEQMQYRLDALEARLTALESR